MKKLHIAFLWHMHQPYYKDDMSMEYRMPWVFLHAVKDYYELPWYLSKFQNCKATFNLVPSLIEQLKEYSDARVNDYFLTLVKKDISHLTKDERLYLCEALFFANLRTMIHPFPRFLELYNFKKAAPNIQNFSASLTDNDFLDLEVLFLLSWCSNSLRESSNIVAALIKKQKAFTSGDKSALLDEMFVFVAKIIPFYKKLQDEGRIEISTTPYYHPILPLLLNKENAKQADQNTPLPRSFADFSSDAAVHVQKAIDEYNQTFDRPPLTFWSSEGSMSSDTLELLASFGVKHVGADEDVLFKSLDSRHRLDVYKKYSVGRSSNMGVLFRDKELSDLIGFTYSNQNAKTAVDDFMGKLKRLHDSISFEAVVPIILDGENAWEYYENNAKDFFETLYGAISKADWCDMSTFSDVFNSDQIESSHIENIKPGSWIYGTFSTWMGHDEKNKAWELLSMAKNAYEEVKDNLTEDKRQAAHKELMIAEGSDWFWWYGDDHYTPQANEFDYLFRKHILNLYKLIEKEPPSKVYDRINTQKVKEQKKKPTNYVSPQIDGKMTDFYEWLGAGSIRLDNDFSAMDSSGYKFEKLLWGFDDENIYFAIFGKFAEIIDTGYELKIDLTGSKTAAITLPLSRKKFVVECVGVDDVGKIKAGVEDVFEVSLPKSCLECANDKLLQAVFEIQKDKKPIERSPLHGVLELEVNEKFLEDWYI
ncbi:MAG: glycoside hydrolase family 57 protein [Campylobacterales bacterium]|nr:glycoside hydrolase family 57 protein [Campylobacterales bacterium]